MSLFHYPTAPIVLAVTTYDWDQMVCIFSVTA